MVNACLHNVGVAASTIVGVASLAISIAQYIKDDENDDDTQDSSTDLSTPSPSRLSSASPAPVSPNFVTMSPTSTRYPSTLSPPPASNDTSADSDKSSINIAEEIFDGWAFGLLVTSL